VGLRSDVFQYAVRKSIDNISVYKHDIFNNIRICRFYRAIDNVLRDDVHTRF